MAENNRNNTVKLDENEILKDTFDLLTDNEQLSDGFFEDEEADKDKELLYPIALGMVFTDWAKLDKYNSTIQSKLFLLLLSPCY
jgi:hypothetical protein